MLLLQDIAVIVREQVRPHKLRVVVHHWINGGELLLRALVVRFSCRGLSLLGSACWLSCASGPGCRVRNQVTLASWDKAAIGRRVYRDVA